MGMQPGGGMMAPGMSGSGVHREHGRERVDPAVRELMEIVGDRFKGNIYELQEKIHDFLREFAPEHLMALEELRQEDRRGYVRSLREAFEFMTEVERIKRENPEQFGLMRSEGEARRRIMQIEQELDHIEADSTDELKERRAKLRVELEKVVGALFDVKIKMRAGEVQRLREELAKQEKAIKAAEGRKEELVKKRVGEILGEEEDIFDW